jgi:hypothetical protein
MLVILFCGTRCVYVIGEYGLHIEYVSSWLTVTGVIDSVELLCQQLKLCFINRCL